MGTQMKSVVLFAALALALYCTCSEAASSSSSTGSSSAATTKGKCTTYGGGHKGATASCTMCINMATTSDGATTVAQKCDTGAGGNKYCNKYGIKWKMQKEHPDLRWENGKNDNLLQRQ